MPTSPPVTTSFESWPTTWPSCIANSEPPTVRMSRPAPSTWRCISSGACSLSTRVSASAMLDRDGLGELLPDRQGRLDPAAAGQRARGRSAARRSSAPRQPERGEREGLVEAVRWPAVIRLLVAMCERLALARGPGSSRCRRRPGCSASAAAASAAASWPGRWPCPRRRRAAPDRCRPLPAEQLAEQLLELVFGVPVAGSPSASATFSRLQVASPQR